METISCVVLLRTIALMCALAAPSAASRTLIVDAASDGEPGRYATIDAALEDAIAGDVVLVSAGTYATPREATRGVALIGCEGAVLDPIARFFRIHDLPPGERFTMAGFRIREGFDLRIWMHSNKGAVHLADLRVQGAVPARVRNVSLWVRDCAVVTLERLSTYGAPALDVMRSTVVAIECDLQGTSWFQGSVRGPGIRAEASHVAIVHGRVQGADSTIGLTAPGIVATGAHITLTGDLVVRGGATGTTVVEPPLCTDMRSVVRLDPAVRLDTGTSPVPVIVGVDPIRPWSIPALRSQGLRGDGVLHVELFASQSVHGIAFVSLPAMPVPTATGDLIWLDPATTVVLGGLATDATRRGRLEFTLPPTVQPGAALSIQALVVAPAGLQLSLPSVAIAGMPAGPVCW
ncbi:MAG: hypothetical protein IPM29_30405 [Planctomycetes bacterium]|nr:hypothetical protein [Planctomycetota bacterium]